MTHLFIINPAAGSKNRSAQYRQTIDAVCTQHGLDYEVYISTEAGDCARKAREAATTGKAYRIYACGGDGTLNEVVQGVAGFDNVSVTVYSGGSGNDFIKIFNEPKAFFDLERLIESDETKFDLIDVNGDISLNICSVGLDARIGTAVSRYKRLPLLNGFRAYAASTLMNVIRGVKEHYVLEINGQRMDAKQTLMCVCNGRFYGGGFNPVPAADPADGVLDVLIVKGVSRLQVAGVIGKYKSGRYHELPKLVQHFRTDRIRILCDKPSPINLDGELRVWQDVTMSVSDKKIRFFYPKGLVWQSNCPSAVL